MKRKPFERLRNNLKNYKDGGVKKKCGKKYENGGVKKEKSLAEKIGWTKDPVDRMKKKKKGYQDGGVSDVFDSRSARFKKLKAEYNKTGGKSIGETFDDFVEHETGYKLDPLSTTYDDDGPIIKYRKKKNK